MAQDEDEALGLDEKADDPAVESGVKGSVAYLPLNEDGPNVINLPSAQTQTIEGEQQQFYYFVPESNDYYSFHVRSNKEVTLNYNYGNPSIGAFLGYTVEDVFKYELSYTRTNDEDNFGFVILCQLTAGVGIYIDLYNYMGYSMDVTVDAKVYDPCAGMENLSIDTSKTVSIDMFGSKTFIFTAPSAGTYLFASTTELDGSGKAKGNPTGRLYRDSMLTDCIVYNYDKEYGSNPLDFEVFAYLRANQTVYLKVFASGSIEGPSSANYTIRASQFGEDAKKNISTSYWRAEYEEEVYSYVGEVFTPPEILVYRYEDYDDEDSLISLVSGRDFEIAGYRLSEDGSKGEWVQNPASYGWYDVKVVGKGNYTGEKTLSEVAFIDERSHSFGTPKVVSATCTAKGYRQYTCANCGEMKKEYTNALGHFWSTAWSWNASRTGATLTLTCTRSGCKTKQNVSAKITSKNSGPNIIFTATASYGGKTYTSTASAGNIANCTVELAPVSFEYDGGVKTPGVVVRSGGTVLANGVDYAASFTPGSTNVGTYMATIAGKGKYVGSITATYIINPKGTKLTKVKSSKKKTLNVSWKKQANQTSGYEVAYSTSAKKDATGKLTGSKVATISKSKTTSTTIKKLKSKKKYNVQIRTFLQVGGQKFCSDWSPTKAAKVK